MLGLENQTQHLRRKPVACVLVDTKALTCLMQVSEFILPTDDGGAQIRRGLTKSGYLRGADEVFRTLRARHAVKPH